MGTYDLEKEIHHILQDSSKIRDYNAKLRSEYIKLNNDYRRLKVENSKLISQNACTEISLAKSKADNFAKSEEVKSLQSVINLLAPKYSNKKNQSDSYVKSSGKKNDISASLLISILDSPIQGEKSSVNSKTDFDKVLSSILAYSIILFLLIVIIWFIVVKKLWNTWEKSDQYIQTRNWHLQDQLYDRRLEGKNGPIFHTQKIYK